MTQTIGATGVWDVRAAAEYIGCSPGTLRVWVSQRRVPYVKVGRLLRFRRADLDKYLDRCAVMPAPK